MAETLTLPPPAVGTHTPAATKWEREYQAFLRLLPELLQTHRGKFVAIHEQSVVDSGDDPVALIKQVHARFGYVPIHVDLVTDAPPAAIRIPHYREYRPRIKT